MTKGFLITDAPGNVIYIPIQSETAKEIARAVNGARKEVAIRYGSTKTEQRHLIGKYIAAKTEEEFLIMLDAKEGGA